MCKAKSLDLLYPEPSFFRRRTTATDSSLDGGGVILELDVPGLVAEVRIGVDRLQVVDEFGVDGRHG